MPAISGTSIRTFTGPCNGFRGRERGWLLSLYTVEVKICWRADRPPIKKFLAIPCSSLTKINLTTEFWNQAHLNFKKKKLIVYNLSTHWYLLNHSIYIIRLINVRIKLIDSKNYNNCISATTSHIPSNIKVTLKILLSFCK